VVGGLVVVARGGRERASLEGTDLPVIVQLRDTLVVAFCFCLFLCFSFLKISSYIIYKMLAYHCCN